MKVAMVLVKAADATGLGLANDDEHYEVISTRVEALVNDGRLAARGDTKNWRASEVRLANPRELQPGTNLLAKSERRKARSV